MLSSKQAANLSARVRFNIVDLDEYGIFDLNNVVEDMPIEQFMEKIYTVNKEWYQTARLDCED